jgi:hypothetical protein
MSVQFDCKIPRQMTALEIKKLHFPFQYYSTLVVPAEGSHSSRKALGRSSGPAAWLAWGNAGRPVAKA